MADTQLIGIPIEDLQEADSSNLTNETKVIVEDDGTPVTRQCNLGVMADWINDRVIVGGRNLFLDTGTERTSSGYYITKYKPANDPLVSGKEYTISMCVTPAENVSSYAIFLSNGHNSPVKTLKVSGVTKQIVTGTFTAFYANGKTPDDDISNADIAIYRLPNDSTVTGASTIHWIKIEKGNKATDWTPAPEDLISSAIPHTKSDGTVTTVKDELLGLNNKIPKYTGDKNVAIGKLVNEIKDTDTGVALTNSVETNIGSARAAVDNDYYTTATGSDASITIKKPGLYSVSAHAYVNLGDSTSQGNASLIVYKDDERIDDICIYTYSTYACRLQTSGIFYLPAGAKLTAKIKPSGSTTGTMSFKGGDLSVIKMD